MKARPILNRIAAAGANHATVADAAAEDSHALRELMEGLHAEKPRVKFGCLKVLRIVSEKEPEVLYPMFDGFVDLLASENTILKWGATTILGNLAVADSDGKLDKILDRYLAPIRGPVMITAANTIGGAGKIATAKPYLADKIAQAILQVEKAKYQTPECRNVAIGHAVNSLDLFFDQIQDRQKVIAFVRRQLRNRRNAVRRKAADSLKRHATAASPEQQSR